MKRPKLRPRYASNSGIFEKRGDPWVTKREGVRDYARNLETEDPEYDFDRRFHSTQNAIGKPRQAVERKEYREPRPVKADDPARRKASILRRVNMSIARQGKVIGEDAPATPSSFKPCAGCRLASCIVRGCRRPNG